MERLLHDMMRERRQLVLANSPQLTLGQMIALLEAMPLTYEMAGKEHPKRIWFDFGQCYPTGLDSWRGSYSELAITFGYDRPKAGEYPTGVDVLKRLRRAVGETFQGYKGGDFTMREDTPVWVANWGDSAHSGVVGIRDTPYHGIIIDTAWCEF